MSKASLVTLSEELSLYIEGQTTNTRAPITTLKRVALILYYLSDEGRLRKTANTFGVSRQAVSVVVRQTSSSQCIVYLCGRIKAPHTGLANILHHFQSVSVVLCVHRYFLRQRRVYGFFF